MAISLKSILISSGLFRNFAKKQLGWGQSQADIEQAIDVGHRLLLRTIRIARCMLVTPSRKSAEESIRTGDLRASGTTALERASATWSRPSACILEIGGRFR
jgi:hypothetical protein